LAAEVSTQVLVAGGGPVGLTAAVELARRGIECLVVEPRHEVSRLRPRCKTLNVRTMEHLRRWGVANRLRERAPLPVNWSTDIVFCTSLAGYELSRFTGVLGLAAHGARFPELGQQAPQYVLEELLRELIGELEAAQLWTGWRVTALEQSGDGANVTIVDAGGASQTVRAAFVLGCDGPRSAVRDAIGAAYTGEHALRPNFGMVFSAPELWEHVRHGPAVQYWVVNDDAPALMGPLDLAGNWWIIAFGIDAASGERRARQIIDAAAGAHVAAKVLSTDPWTARMQLVDRSRRGRVFLAGDAAHLNPPFGGHGLNTGFGDAIDLGWKLAAVLDGWGGEGLLDSYEAERRPIQTAVIAAAVANMKVLSTDLLSADITRPGRLGELARQRAHERIQATKHAEFHALDLVLDLAYESSPVLAPPSGPAGAAHPGARLPHVWLGPADSVYDRLGDGMTLIALDDAPAHGIEVLLSAARCRGVPMRLVRLRGPELRRRWGAALIAVRPDQHVGWAAAEAPPDPLALIDRLRGAGR
jgi:2-polyprenyl-6-methoxyphenol hydroxylase-like FAD-dependent oxidoreductase